MNEQPSGDGASRMPKPQQKKKALSFAQRMRAYLMTGILVVAPISITIYLAWIFIGFVDDRVTPLIPAKYNPETYLPFALPGLGLLVLTVALILVGAATAGFFGRLWTRSANRYSRTYARDPKCLQCGEADFGNGPALHDQCLP